MRATSLAVAALLVLLAAAPAYGADLKILETVDGGGDPGLTAAMVPDDDDQDVTLEWRRCADGGTVCEPLPASAWNGWSRVAFPGETAAGTVFEAVATHDGVETTVRTRAWQGRVASSAPPALQGDAAVGKTVTVTPGAWAGGWGPGTGVHIADFVYACREPAGGDCWLISYSGAAAVDARWTGWYLLAAEVLEGDAWCNRITACVLDNRLLPPPFASTPQPGATLALSAPLGPVAGPPVVAPPVPKPPAASIRARALRSKGQLLVGRVSCETRCTVQLKVSGGHRRAVYNTLSVTGAKALTVPVRHGKLKVRVIVDGKLVTSGPTLAR